MFYNKRKRETFCNTPTHARALLSSILRATPAPSRALLALVTANPLVHVVSCTNLFKNHLASYLRSSYHSLASRQNDDTRSRLLPCGRHIERAVSWRESATMVWRQYYSRHGILACLQLSTTSLYFSNSRARAERSVHHVISAMLYLPCYIYHRTRLPIIAVLWSEQSDKKCAVDLAFQL